MQLMFPGELIDSLSLAMENTVIPGSRLPTKVGTRTVFSSGRHKDLK